MIGVAILGTGDIANTHIESFQYFSERCEIKVLVNKSLEKAQAKASKYQLQCDCFSDYHELLNRDDIHLISICLPPALHCQVAIDFLLAGKHVLCEKPMAQSLDECDRMIAAAKQSGSKLSIIAQNRFKTDIVRTKAMIENKKMGDLYFAQVNSLWWRGEKYYDLWWRGTWQTEGGGCTFIHAVHHIDLFLWLMGNVTEVTSLIANKNHHNSEVEDLSITTVRFENGALGSLTSSLLHHSKVQNIIIDCQHGSIEMPNKISVCQQLANGYPEPDEPAQVALMQQFEALPALTYIEHQGQIENMLSAIENNHEPMITGSDGRKTIEFISAVYQSAFTKTTTTLPLTAKDPFYTKEGAMQHVIKFNEKTGNVSGFSDIGISVGGSL